MRDGKLFNLASSIWKEKKKGFGDIYDVALTRLDCGLVMNEEREGESKDDLEFPILFQESNRERICLKTERKRKYSEWDTVVFWCLRFQIQL